MKKEAMDSLNVVLFAPDTVRRDHLSCYGYHRETTPNLDELAKRSVILRGHIANSGWTLPQYMTMHTGLYPLTHGMTLLKGNPPLSPKIMTIAEVLKEQGYATVGFTSSNGYLHPELGYGRGFDKYLWKLGYNQAAERIVDNAIDWINKFGRRKKFFLFIQINDTHEPFNPPKPFDSMWGDEYINKYDEEITHVDYHFGRLVEEIERLGMGENTLIVYTSDHGTEFWEHGFLEKKVNLYNEVLHIPLVMYCPSLLPEGKIMDGLVATVDLFPTILDILNIPLKTVTQGRSFLPYILGELQSSPHKVVFSHTEHNSRVGNVTKPSFEHFSVYTERYKFICAKILLPFTEEFFEIVEEGGGNWVTRFRALARRVGIDPKDIKQGTVFRELYDLEADPSEQRNIIEEERKIAEELERMLDRWIREARQLGSKLRTFSQKPIMIGHTKRLIDRNKMGRVRPQCPIPILVNAGGRGYVDRRGRRWFKDQEYIPGKWGYTTETYTDVLSTSDEIEGTLNPYLYQSQRFGQSFSYIFHIPNGRYKVTLHFAEIIMNIGGIEFFDVYLQGKLILRSYNIFNDAGGRNIAVRKSFVCEVTENQLTIQFIGLTEPQQEAAKVSAIEIESLP